MIKKLMLFIGVYLCLGLTIIKVPNTFLPSNQKEWDSILYTINRSSENDFLLLWEGLGGKLDIAMSFYKRLNLSHKNITVQIVGESVSAHSLVYCFVKKNVIFEKGSLVFHNVYLGRNKKGIKQYNDRSTYRVLDQCRMTGIITEQDENQIIQNKLRMYVYPNGKKITYKDWE